MLDSGKLSVQRSQKQDKKSNQLLLSLPPKAKQPNNRSPPSKTKTSPHMKFYRAGHTEAQSDALRLADLEASEKNGTVPGHLDDD